MKNITCILDACSVINLIHIDEDDFLLKKLENLDVKIHERVFSEINKHVYKKLDLESKSKYSNKETIEEKRKVVDQRLSYYRGMQVLQSIIDNDFGEKFAERLQKLIDYAKDNGELHSTSLALYLSRTEDKKVYFYTDDYPANEEFTPFYNFQQIGHIKDSVDLLVLLFWLNETFTLHELKQVLNRLRSEYATDIASLEKSLKDYSSNLDASFVRANSDIRKKLHEFIDKLSKHNFTDLSEYRLFFERKRSSCKPIISIIEEYPSVFELENASKNILQKIQSTLKSLEIYPVQKLGDCIS